MKVMKMLKSEGLPTEDLSTINPNLSWGIDSYQLIDEAILVSREFLKKLALDRDFLAKISQAFGQDFNADALEDLRQQWIAGHFQSFPKIEIISSAEINGKNGAYSAANNKISLSREFLISHTYNLQAIVNLFLEEYGHFVAAKIDVSDPPRLSFRL